MRISYFFSLLILFIALTACSGSPEPTDPITDKQKISAAKRAEDKGIDLSTAWGDEVKPVMDEGKPADTEGDSD